MRILVTGAGRAIGRSTCEVLTSAGHDVVATARDVAILDGLEVAQRLPLDVTSQASVDACLGSAGELDAIVNNAALSASGDLETLSEALHYELGHFGIRTVLVEPGYTAPGMKGIDRELPTSGPYVELYAQMNGADDSVTNGAGRPGPETVAEVIRAAIEHPETPLRVPVGPDAELVLPTRASMSDVDFEATMRAVLGLTW